MFSGRESNNVEINSEMSPSRYETAKKNEQELQDGKTASPLLKVYDNINRVSDFDGAD